MFRTIICLVLVIIFCPFAKGQSVEYNAVIAGINEYDPLANSLNYAVKDAENMKYALETNQGWQSANIQLFTNAQVKLSTLYNNIYYMPRTTGNTNLFYFSGHGSTDGFLIFNDNGDNTCNFAPYLLEEQMGDGGFNQYTAIIDACQSGVFAEEMSTGVILTACESDEYAAESAYLENGIFTYNVLDGLRNNNAAGYDGLLSAEELYWYAFYRTFAYTLNQTPMLSDNYSGNLVLNYNSNLARYSSMPDELDGESLQKNIANNYSEVQEEVSEDEISTDYVLFGNYPNPFNPTTTISYNLPEAGNVQIKVYDVLGREVAKLIDETKSVGKHSVAWNGSSNTSGIYFYTITFNNQTLYKKMLLIK